MCFPASRKSSISQSVAPGIQAWQDHDIDVFSAVPDESELLNCPEPFLEKRPPQMLLDLARKRKNELAQK
jgi:hypothetical protein